MMRKRAPIRKSLFTRPSVERLEDRTLLSTFTVLNTNDAGAGSLRQAILDANANPGADLIAFDIGGGGVQTITPTSLLPYITDSLIIDGYTQPGSSPNTLSNGDNAILTIELDGSDARPVIDGTTEFDHGLVIFADDSTVRGLVVNRFGGGGIALAGHGNVVAGNFLGTDVTGTLDLGNFDGVEVSHGLNNLIGGTTPGVRNIISGNDRMGVFLVFDSTGNSVQGNFIGTDRTGTLTLGNSDNGVAMSTDASYNLIGGTADGARNIISANGWGIDITSSSIGNVVQGNYIGTDVAGTLDLGNFNDGIDILISSNNVIGGTTPEARNLISGNNQRGVLISASTGTLVQGNFIGTDGTGTQLLGNGDKGVLITSAASNNTIGGTASGSSNMIANNGVDGVTVAGVDAIGNAILSNSIHDNASLGINLGYGANDNQAAPVLTGLAGSAANPAIIGTLAGVANTPFRIEFFANQSPDPSGFGEGQTYLGFATVTTDGSGNAGFTASLSIPLPLDQRYFSATATNLSTNDTSAFAKDLFLPFNFSGFRPPLSNNTVFALNRTIPIKFQLTDVNGAVITSLSAVTSLQVAPILSGGGLGTPFNPAPSAGTGLRNDGSQYVFNWQTKGLGAGSYEILLTLTDGTVETKVLQLAANGAGGALLVDGTGIPPTTAAGALLGGNIELYVDNSNGDLTTDELARIQDAVTAADAVTEPYGVAVVEVTDPTLADVTLNMDTTSAVGGYADGVLGCTTDAGQITLIQGWNFYAGSDATQIGSAQYDFETVVTHELGHALGLGHSTDSTSVMYATLNTGTVNRSLTTADLNVADSDTTGACGLHAAMIPIPTSAPAVPDSPNNTAPARDAFFALLSNQPSAMARIPAAQFANAAQDVIFANSAGEFGTMLPASEQTALRASAIFATGSTSTDERPFGIASIFPDSLGEGSEDRLAPMAPPSFRPDAGFDFMPANGTMAMEI